jgi:ABC-type transport system involved in cytochrome bd biosynthesis fused ATPase/permease subunit
MAFQGVFLMGAFSAAMKIQPCLKPLKENTVRYRPLPRGVQIQARSAIKNYSEFSLVSLPAGRNLSYTYPGNKEPSLKDINFSLDAGESLAIVGYNGSGAYRRTVSLGRIF